MESSHIKVIVSELGRAELNRLGFDIVKAIDRIVSYIPRRYVLGLSYILVTDLPVNKKSRREKAMGAYFRRQNNHPAHIEIYLKTLFGHIRSVESFGEMLPIQEFGLATVIFHEFGHHIIRIITHDIKKDKSERAAESYVKRIIDKYALDNAKSINGCFDHLESIAQSRGLSQDSIRKMRVGWERTYKRAVVNDEGYPSRWSLS